LRVNFAGCCCLVDLFFAWRESFSLSKAVSAHTLPPGDISETKVVKDRSFSILYWDGAQLFIDLPEELDMGIPTRQRNPHLSYRNADQRADL
jgi:hypothetical protein